MKVCDKTCIFFFFPIINKYLCMAKRSLLSRCPSYIHSNEIHNVVALLVYHEPQMFFSCEGFKCDILLWNESRYSGEQRSIYLLVTEQNFSSQGTCRTECTFQHVRHTIKNQVHYITCQEVTLYSGTYTYIHRS